MPVNSDRVRVGANGSVYVAPVGTVAPVDVSAAWAAGWIELGYTSEDGVTFTDEREIEDILGWQSFYPIRKIVTGKNATAAFELREWSRATVQLAFGGGTIITTAGPPIHYRYDPPDPSIIDERALGIEWKDGTLTYRLIMVKALVSETVETNVTRAAAADLPITMSMIGAGGVAPWYIRTNDPAFAV